MFEQVYYLLNIFEKVDSIQGRKKVQKMVHLLKQKGVGLNFRYEYHHYGPYSSDLQSMLNDMVEQGYLFESHGNGAYTYSITEKGKEFKRKLDQVSIIDEISLPSNFETYVKGLDQKSSQFLEVVSTYSYLLENAMDPQIALQKTKELKHHLDSMMDDAVKFYDEFMAL